MGGGGALGLRTKPRPLGRAYCAPSLVTVKVPFLVPVKPRKTINGIYFDI